MYSASFTIFSETVTRKVKLKDLGSWSGGGTPSMNEQRYWRGGSILWVTPKDFGSPTIMDTKFKITPAAVQEKGLRTFPPSSIMIVVRSGILRHRVPIATSAVPFTVNQDLKVLAPSSDVEPHYIFHALRSLEPQILNRCVKSGTTVESVDVPSLKELSIPLPHRAVQKRIGVMLTVHDQLASNYESSFEQLLRLKEGLAIDLLSSGSRSIERVAK